MAAKLGYREGVVKVPELAAWFDGKDDPAWTVRNMTGKELGRVNEAVAKHRNIQAVVEKLVSKSPKKIADGVENLLVGADTPEDIAKRIDMLIIGSVDPICDLQMALKLCEGFGVVFYSLTNKILELTGSGHIVGGQKPSGNKKK